MTDAAIKGLIAQGISDALVEYEANRSSRNGDDIYDSGCDGRRQRVDSMNSHLKTVGHDAAHGMPWKTLMKMMTDKYCPRSEMKKLEIKIWNLKVKGTDVVSYTQRFQELALMCGRIFPEESHQVEKYVGGLPDMIQGSVMASKPKTMQEAIEFANDLMDQKIRDFAERHNIARVYTAGPSEKKEYARTLPLCNKCKLHHNGPSTVRCGNCKKVGHMTQDCRNIAATNNKKTLTCFECGNQGHYKSECPELKNRNHGNQPRNGEARRKVCALGGGETNQDPNNMEDDINA
ncbi:retrovirus-related pol polyprotein from transposon 17.6 [Tanacetum coccineum]